MALVTVHRSPTPSNCTAENLSGDPADDVDSARSPHRSHSFSESYLAVKGAALILRQSDGTRIVKRDSQRGDIECHLQSMFYLLRDQDTIKVAVKLERRSSPLEHHRYLALVSTTGTQDLEESIILGIDVVEKSATIGLVLPIWSDFSIRLDGDGGYSVTSNERQHIFKPVSVQAMWSSLQCLNKVRDVAAQNSYLPDGLTHTWVQYYRTQIRSDRSFIAEWHAMDDLESRREDLVTSESQNSELEKTIRTKLREMALTVDFEEVTSKQLRMKLEEDLGRSLAEFRHFIDEEIVIIFRQMEAPSKIFDYLYLGTEWNASNLDELKNNGFGYILNVAREIDNFFPGSFHYQNIRVHDTEDADLMKHWDKTYKFISDAKNSNSKVLVHCKMGVSRSASTVVAFAMKEMSWNCTEALKFVQKQRSCVQPNKGFMRQLETYQGILDASKHRHNKLWKSATTGLHTSTPIRETDSNVLEMEGSSSETSSEPDVQDASYADNCLISAECNSLVDEHLCLAVDLQSDSDDDVSSRSESQEDIRSLELDVDAELMDEGVGPAGSPVTLLRYEKVDRDIAGVAVLLSDDFGEVEPEEPLSKRKRHCSQGYYDISMLAGYRVNDDDDDDAFMTNDEVPLLHPDLVVECIQAENRKKRQTLKFLCQKQETSVIFTSGNDCKPSSDPVRKRGSRGSRVSESSEGNGSRTKVRPDNYWIVHESSDDIPGCAEQGAAANQREGSPVTFQLGKSADLVSSGSHVDHSYSSCEFSKPSVGTSAECRAQAVENQQECQMLTSVGSAEGGFSESSSMHGESFGSSLTDVRRLIKISSEATLHRPKSIYETEDILLEPGIVLKTKREIEQREKSCSSIDLSFGKESKSVQRSSSWRLDRSKSRDRNSERRRTCLPVLMPSPPSTDRPTAMLLDMSDHSGRDVRGTGDIAGENDNICCFGAEDVEVEKGIVKKTTKGFQEGLSVPLAVFTSLESSNQSQSPFSVSDDVPVEPGTVKRQTKHIETRYRSVSPHLSKANRFESDLEAGQHGDSNSCENAASRNAAGDSLAGSGQATAGRDERRLHLSLSKNLCPSAAQTFGSPERQRRELFSAPLDLTQKELSTRRTSSPMRDDYEGFVGSAIVGAKKTSHVSGAVEPRPEPVQSSSPLQRNLSQNSLPSRSVGVSDDTDELGSFCRTRSLRETSGTKADDRLASSFGRSRSLRFEKAHRLAENVADASPQSILKQGSLPASKVVVDARVRLQHDSSVMTPPVDCHTSGTCCSCECKMNTGTDSGTAMCCSSSANHDELQSGAVSRQKNPCSTSSTSAPPKSLCNQAVTASTQGTATKHDPKSYAKVNDDRAKAENLTKTELQVQKVNPESGLGLKHEDQKSAGCEASEKETPVSTKLLKSYAKIQVAEQRGKQDVNVMCISSAAAAAAETREDTKSCKMEMPVRDRAVDKAELQTTVSVFSMVPASSTVPASSRLVSASSMVPVSSTAPVCSSGKASLQSNYDETGTKSDLLSLNADCTKRFSNVKSGDDSGSYEDSLPSSLLSKPEKTKSSTADDNGASSRTECSKISAIRLSTASDSVQSSSNSSSDVSTVSVLHASKRPTTSSGERYLLGGRCAAEASHSDVVTVDNVTLTAASVVGRVADALEHNRTGVCAKDSMEPCACVAHDSESEDSRSVTCSAGLPGESWKQMDRCKCAKDRGQRNFKGSASQILETAEPADSTGIFRSSQSRAINSGQNKLPSMDSVHESADLEPKKGDLSKILGELDKRELRGKVSGESSNLTQPDETASLAEDGAVRPSGVVLRKKKPIREPGSVRGSDVRAALSNINSSATARSLSLHDDSSQSSVSQTSKQLYGKSHPLRRLSAGLISHRPDAGFPPPAIDVASGSDRL